MMVMCTSTVGGICRADDVGILSRSGLTAVLPAVSSGMSQTGEQTSAVGADEGSVYDYTLASMRQLFEVLFYGLKKTAPSLRLILPNRH
jgi:hypothetical protein